MQQASHRARRLCATSGLVAALLASLVVPATAKTPIAYTRQLETPAGRRTVQLRGHYDGKRLRAQITINGMAIAVVGDATADGLRGSLQLPDGRPLGRFVARPVTGTALDVTYQYGTATGTIRVPVDDVQLDSLRRAVAAE